jgi:ceramide glucosyltransferase
MAWYAAEGWLAYRAGWQLSRWSMLIWLLRDALVPALWICAWAGDEFVWRGHPMSVADSSEVALASPSNLDERF